MKRYSRSLKVFACVATAVALLFSGTGCNWQELAGTEGTLQPGVSTGSLTPTLQPTFGIISRAELPPEALDTLRLIAAGGLFPYAQDASIFHNYERLLPAKPDGYYREYTVITPGATNRGARRIVTGGAGEYYYTDDHYESFRLIQG